MSLRLPMTVLLLCCAATPARGGAPTITTTTTYAYNADGALTAVTTQVDSEPATTIYVTWDNFTPNADAPTTGTVSAADGNLLGLSPLPGTRGFTKQFAYDVRDRLTSCTTTGQAVNYAYHPNSLMASSTLASGDALQFYYDNTATPLMVNTQQPSTGMTDSFLGPVRYLSDGTEQLLLLPRKDTAGVYDPSAQTLSPYSYDPYGASATDAPPASSSASSYDLSQNPFQYAGEYQDPTCSTYYLRARWYLPKQQTFLSRDPVDALHRYSYTGGNPVSRVDPSGLRYTGMDFSRGVGKAVHKLAPGIWSYLEPILPIWGQALGGIELLGALPTFFHHPTLEKGLNFGFLAASILFEAGAESTRFDRLAGGVESAFRWRLAGDAVLGGSQTLAQSYRHRRIDVPALIQGIDTTLYGMFWARAVTGIGYRPYGLSAGDLDSMAGLYRDAGSTDALVFRVRYDWPKAGWTSPLRETFHIGNYHEAMLAIAPNSLWHGDVWLRGGVYTWETNWSREADDLNAPSNFLPRNLRSRLQFVGRFRQDAVEDAFRSQLSFGEQQMVAANARGESMSPFEHYSVYRNNCQDAAARMRRDIVHFQRSPSERLDSN